jgi:hypothetical protein
LLLPQSKQKKRARVLLLLSAFGQTVVLLSLFRRGASERVLSE